MPLYELNYTDAESQLIDDFELLSSNVEPPPEAPLNGRPAWTSTIQLVSTFASKFPQMVTLMRCLREAEDPEEIQRFLQDPEWCPPGCGWIYPLISQFEANRNQSAVLLLLQCPKYNHSVNPLSPDPSCCTDIFITAVTSCKFNNRIYPHSILLTLLDFNKQGIKCITMNYRKECRRSKDNQHCPNLSKTEVNICAIATMAEVHIARSVYGIKFVATIAISSNSCHGAACLQENIEFKPLLGTVYNIRWHPSALVGLAFFTLSHELQNAMAKEMVTRDYVPTVQAILQQFGVGSQSSLWDYITLSCVTCDNPILATVFVPPLDLHAVTPWIRPIGNLKLLSNYKELDAVRRDNMSAQSQVGRFFRFQRLRCRAAVRLLQRLQQLFPDIDFGWVHEARLDPTTAGFSPPVLGDGRS